MDKPPPEIVETHAAYTAALQAVMLDFQFIEEGLRRYMARAYELIRERTADVLQFKLAEKDLEKDALGKLAQKFGQLSGNSVLCATIQKLVPMRNMCAHKGLLITHQIADVPEQFEGLISGLVQLQTDTGKCVRALIDEGKKIGAS